MTRMAESDRYAEKRRSWQDNLNNVVRNVIFEDEKLKELMLLPPDTDIVDFTDKYFIRDGSTDELLTNEKVRIVHHDSQGFETFNPNVRGKYHEFDIYVSEDVEHTGSDDYLQSRQVLIAERLKYLLLRRRNIEHLRFRYEDEYDQWTKTVGYKMYKLTVFYKTTV